MTRISALWSCRPSFSLLVLDTRLLHSLWKRCIRSFVICLFKWHFFWQQYSRLEEFSKIYHEVFWWNSCMESQQIRHGHYFIYQGRAFSNLTNSKKAIHLFCLIKAFTLFLAEVLTIECNNKQTIWLLVD